MRSTVMTEDEQQLRLEASIHGLSGRVPLVSSKRVLSRGQRIGGLATLGLVLLVAVGVAAMIGPVTTVKDLCIGLIAIATLVYFSATIYRFVLFMRSTDTDALTIVTDEEALAFPDELLPTYSLLIPAYREPEVIRLVIEHIDSMSYPRNRLEVLLLVEADDEETLEAIGDADPGEHFRLVLIPPAEPRTKPKAMNFGLSVARGELVAVYDAEDEPDPLQLRRAAVAMASFGPEVGCVQAKLSYSNPNQNIITRCFTLEYGMWFSLFLPGLAAMNAPIPLGGTSNHFRTQALRALGAWDPFNVTEDADLGIRMYREGYRVKVLQSITYEEANSDFVNWVRQRSRWYKGYLQTFFVHLRQPIITKRELGWKGLAHFCVFVGGTPILAILNPLFWLLTALWFLGQPNWIRQIFPAPVYYMGLMCFVFGNFLLYYLAIVSCRYTRRTDLLWAALLTPMYWVMMSIAALKALLQLVIAPNFWEKTAHGLHPQVITPTSAHHTPVTSPGSQT